MKRVAVTILSSLFLALGLGSGAAEQPAVDTKSDVALVVKGDTEFALALYERLQGEQGNLFLSPYSISTALTMTYAGAQGKTATEMAHTLHLPFGEARHPPTRARLLPAIRALIQELNNHGLPRDYQLVVANALWGQRHNFLPNFLEAVRANFGAGIRNVDFHNPELARQAINRWVASQTNDKIKELLQPPDINSLTELVLTNTIYFKASWLQPFRPEATRNADFTVAADKKVSVPLMHQGGDFPYFDGGSYQALALPYEGDDMQMVVLLPKKADGLAELEKGLTAEKLGACLAGLKPVDVAVTLPKFKVSARFDLGGVLSALGMPTAFTPKADFSGMSAARALYISKVIHQAYVDVDEQGTEAAAATAVIMMRAAAPTKRIEFRADHPFVFLIRDMRTNSLLFLGRLQNPQA
jgi:serpin B